jgi:glycosyltransferase involved in cell wall biosynthesis
MARGYDLCLTNTQEALEFLRDFLHIPASRVVCRPYEVPDLDVLNHAGQSLVLAPDRKRPVFLFAGVLVERKGLDCLLRAAESLKRRDVCNFSLSIVGSGDQYLELQRLAASLGLEQQISWLGHVPYDQMGAYYCECDVFVFPTREDIWGMVALEAMAFGKPIICSQYAGAREVVREGVNGFIVDPCDTEELACRMERFIREPELIGRFGAASRAIMVPHTSTAAAAMLAQTIRSVLRGNTDRAVPTSISEPA